MSAETGNVELQAMTHGHEDDDAPLQTEYMEWWKADYSYLPIHRFKKQMTKYCLELNENPSAKRVQTICEEISAFISAEMNKEIELEYGYSYDKGIIHWQTQGIVQTGYIDCLKHILTKLVRAYLSTKDKNIRAFVFKFHTKWFGKPRYWDDQDLISLDDVLKRI